MFRISVALTGIITFLCALCCASWACAQEVQARSVPANLDASVPPIAGVVDPLTTMVLSDLGWRAPVTLPVQVNPAAFAPPPAARTEADP